MKRLFILLLTLMICNTIQAQPKLKTPDRLYTYTIEGHQYKEAIIENWSISFYRTTTWPAEEFPKYTDGSKVPGGLYKEKRSLKTPQGYKEQAQGFYNEVFTKEQREVLKGSSLEAYVFFDSSANIIGVQFDYLPEQKYVDIPKEYFYRFEEKLKTLSGFYLEGEGKTRTFYLVPLEFK